ncbi:MAG: hypothetical protein PHV30_02530 [Candidatus Margulisbacteria bacterium]|nr:hypothetical protein [Candidatus Margulisiibacteriota bacterium]
MFNATELAFFLMENILEGILIFNDKLEVVYANKIIEFYLGLQHHEIMGKKCGNLLNGQLCAENGLMTKAMNTGIMEKEYFEIKDKKYQLRAYSFKGKKDEASYKTLLFLPTTLTETETPTCTEEVLQKEEINAIEFGNRIIENMQDLSEAKNIPVNLLVDEHTDVLYINPGQMEFAIMNLMSKAIKFSEKGKITLHIMERETGNSNLIKIENPEEKIAEDHYSDLIASFSKGTDKAKNIVEAHGGKLWLETQAGFAIIFSVPKKLF